MPTVDGMVSCGITRRFPISLHQLFLRATNHRKPLKPACTIPCVTCWALFIFIHLCLPISLSAWACRLFCNFWWSVGSCELQMCLQLGQANCVSRHFLIFSSISAGWNETSQFHFPNPPCVLTAFTHSFKNSRFVWFC